MLKFYWGVVGSGKTLNLLKEYADLKRLNQKNVLLVKPRKDTRTETVYSRFGPVEAMPDMLLDDTSESMGEFVDKVTQENITVVFVDEVQFLSPAWVYWFRMLSDSNVDIKCFGLRNDSNFEPFKTAERLFNSADEIIEIPSTCECCGKPAKFSQLKAGADPGVGFGYFAVCFNCYTDQKQPGSSE